MRYRWRAPSARGSASLAVFFGLRNTALCMQRPLCFLGL